MPTFAEVWAALPELVMTQEFGLRCLISGGIAALLYIVFGALMHLLFFRKVDRDIFARTPYADVALGLWSVVWGSPWLQLFGVVDERFPGFSKMYYNFNDYSLTYWLLSIPAYLLLWDAVFYVTHLILHTQLVYRFSHANHHAFRPPTAWSGIAIDSIETFFSGLLPYLVPLFIAPFHVYTVYAVNIVLVGWATMLHSSCPWKGNWLMIGPLDHNVHHNKGINNANFGAIFKLWDRMFGTLDTTTVPYWIAHERKAAVDGKKAY